MFDQSRHYPLKNIKWERELVQQAIEDIADDALKQLEKRRKLPLHPLDDFGGSGLYIGMTGVLWALTYLDRVHAIEANRDFTALLAEQLSANEKESKSMPHPENASYLFGELANLMLQFQCARSPHRRPDLSVDCQEQYAANSRIHVGERGFNAVRNLFAHVDIRKSMAGDILTASGEDVE